MFDLEQELSQIIVNQHIATALDLGAGRGLWTHFLAKNNIQTTAVDNQSMPLRQFDKNLLTDSNITFVDQNIEEYIQQTNQTFDLILLLNVVVFIPKSIFLETILPQIIDHINPQGYFVFSFFFADDETMQGPKSNFYSFEDFDFPVNNFKIIKKEDLRVDDIHKPHGPHKHHIGYMVVKKR